ncbi:hypothetical protein Tco_1354359 [Tanacetum coccineum]
MNHQTLSLPQISYKSLNLQSYLPLTEFSNGSGGVWDKERLWRRVRGIGEGKLKGAGGKAFTGVMEETALGGHGESLSKREALKSDGEGDGNPGCFHKANHGLTCF